MPLATGENSGAINYNGVLTGNESGGRDTNERRPGRLAGAPMIEGTRSLT
jgi:hypothetical protein